MAAREYQEEISKVDITLKSIEQVLNLPKLIESAIELERQASEPNLWDDPQAAQVITSKLSRAQSTINKISSIRTRLDDLPVMLELAGNESDKAAAYKDIDQELDNLTKIINDLEVQTLLSGEYDERDALMTIRSEAGGVEAADWAQMLMRMYVRFCERHNYKIDVLETSYAEEAGIKSMAMPAIETGVFKFPPELSAEIIITGLLNRSEDSPEIHLVRICVGAQEMKAVFASTFAAKISSPA